MESILLTIRSMLGIQEEYDGFDTALIANINTAIFSLSQVGIGPDGGFTVTDEDDQWADLYSGVGNLQGVKTYIFLSVRMVFDPPGTSFLLKSTEATMNEILWRLQVEVDPDFVPEE